MRFRILINILFLYVLIMPFITSSLKAQVKDNVSVNLNYHYGFTLPEYSGYSYIINDNASTVELRMLKQTTGDNFWQQLYNYPQYGISLAYSTIGNNAVFGKELAVFPFVSLHTFSANKFYIDNAIGIGLSYVSKKFDAKTNYLNFAVGSHVNIHFNYKLSARYQLGERYFIHAGAELSHYSNANSREPNVGVNTLSVFGGVEYLLSPVDEKTIHEVPELSHRNEFSVTAALGGKHTRALQAKVYVTSSVSVDYTRKLFHAFNLGVGADLFYDSSTEIESRVLFDDSDINDINTIYEHSAAIYNAANNPNYKNRFDYKSGVHLSQEFVYNKFSITVQEGIYLLLTDELNHRKMYHKGIFKYKITKNLFTSISMKSYFHYLDYPEIGIGYYW